MTRSYTHLSLHKYIRMGLIAVALISIFAYVSLTVATIFATAGRSRDVAQASRLTSRIGDLEAQYLALSNSITASEATTRGYVTPKNVTLAQASGAMALSLNTR